MPNLILVRNEYQDYGALRRVLDYVLRSSLCGGYGIDPNMAYEQMVMVKNVYHKQTGVQLKHFFLTFSDQEMLHLDSDHTHLHFVMNTTSFLDGYKYSDGLSKFNALCRYLRERYPRFETHLFHTEHYNALSYYTNEKKGVYQMLE